MTINDTPWPFSDPPDTEVITLARILKGEAPLRLVTHDADDGAWQFLDGEHVFEEDAAVVSLGFIAMLEPAILTLSDLPTGWQAYRDDADQPWRKSAEEQSPDDPE